MRGNEISSRKKVVLCFEILGQTKEYRVFVIDGLHEDFILGIDFIRDQNLGYCPKHREFFWEGGCPQEHTRNLKTKKSIHLAALSTHRCQVQLDRSIDSTEKEAWLAQISMDKQPWICGHPALVSIDERNSAWVTITNASPVARTIDKGEVVGQIERCEVLEECGSEGQFVASVTPSSKTHIELKDKGFIDDHAKVECEPEEKLKYLNVLYHFSDVFSKHKNDLGRYDLLQHEIFLKDPTPVYRKQFKIPEGHASDVLSVAIQQSHLRCKEEGWVFPPGPRLSRPKFSDLYR